MNRQVFTEISTWTVDSSGIDRQTGRRHRPSQCDWHLDQMIWLGNAENKLKS